MQTYDGTLNRNRLYGIAGCTVQIVFMLFCCLLWHVLWLQTVCYMSDLSNDFVAHFQLFYVIVASKELSFEYTCKMVCVCEEYLSARVSFPYMSSLVHLSVVCLTGTFVQPTQVIEIFGNVLRHLVC